jgi:hypothetical protein
MHPSNTHLEHPQELSLISPKRQKLFFTMLRASLTEPVKF